MNKPQFSSPIKTGANNKNIVAYLENNWQLDYYSLLWSNRTFLIILYCYVTLL